MDSRGSISQEEIKEEMENIGELIQQEFIDANNEFQTQEFFPVQEGLMIYPE